MTQNGAAAPAEVKPRTEAELLAEIKALANAGKINELSKVTKEFNDLMKGKEKAEQDARQKELEALTAKVKGQIDTFIQTLITDKKLDKADGVWYTYDFGEKLSICRLMKSAPRKAGGGGGTGKKYNVSTSELLEKYGSEVYKDDQTYSQVHEGSTDKNVRYNVREALLKKGGYIQ